MDNLKFWWDALQWNFNQLLFWKHFLTNLFILVYSTQCPKHIETLINWYFENIFWQTFFMLVYSAHCPKHIRSIHIASENTLPFRKKESTHNNHGNTHKSFCIETTTAAYFKSWVLIFMVILSQLVEHIWFEGQNPTCLSIQQNLIL